MPTGHVISEILWHPGERVRYRPLDPKARGALTYLRHRRLGLLALGAKYEKPLTKLRYAEVRGLDDLRSQNLVAECGYLLKQSVQRGTPIERNQPGNVLQQEGARREVADESKEVDEEGPAARICVSSSFEALVTAKKALSCGDAKGLTRRPAYDDVRSSGVFTGQSLEEIPRNVSDIAAMCRRADDWDLRVVGTKRVARPPLQLHKAHRSEPCGLKPEVKAASAGK